MIINLKELALKVANKIFNGEITAWKFIYRDTDGQTKVLGVSDTDLESSIHRRLSGKHNSLKNTQL